MTAEEKDIHDRLMLMVNRLLYRSVLGLQDKVANDIKAAQHMLHVQKQCGNAVMRLFNGVGDIDLCESLLDIEGEVRSVLDDIGGDSDA